MSGALKRRAAEAAAERILSGQKIGLGTGSTADVFLEALARRRRRGDLEEIVGVATSERTERRARELGIPLTTLEREPRLDLTVDGADEVDPRLDLIKGLGGALLREKIVASASRELVIIVDESKLVPGLGAGSPVPVEVLTFGWRVTAGQLEALGARVALRREGGEVFRSDEGNRILDCRFDDLGDASALAARIDAIPGVLGHGLFLAMADRVIVGTAAGTTIRERQ